jgi:hypothetical protein
VTGVTVARYTLTPHEQTVRLPLDAWADEVRALLGDANDELSQLTFCGNNASLVLAHAGDWDRARAICEAQIARVMREPASRLVYAVQPWINLGRLRLLEGDPAVALLHYGALDPRRGPTRFGELVVPSDAWDDVGVTAAQRAALYVVDVVRVFLRQRDDAALSRFVEELTDHVTGEAEDVLVDARLALATLQGETTFSITLGSALAKEDDTLRGDAYLIRAVEALVRIGDRTSAASACESLAARLLRRALARSSGLFLGFLRRRAAELSILAGAPELGRELHRSALVAARFVRDEILEIECLDDLLPLEPGDTRFRAARDAVRGRTLYRRFRNAPASPAIDRLYDEILEALRRPFRRFSE